MNGAFSSDVRCSNLFEQLNFGNTNLKDLPVIEVRCPEVPHTKAGLRQEDVGSSKLAKPLLDKHAK